MHQQNLNTVPFYNIITANVSTTPYHCMFLQHNHRYCQHKLTTVYCYQSDPSPVLRFSLVMMTQLRYHHNSHSLLSAATIITTIFHLLLTQNKHSTHITVCSAFCTNGEWNSSNQTWRTLHVDVNITQTHTHTHTHICIYIYIYVYVCVYICVCMYLCMYIYIYISTQFQSHHRQYMLLTYADNLLRLQLHTAGN